MTPHAPSLAPGDLEPIAAELTTVRFPRGSVVFEAGAQPEAVWIVQSGAIALLAGAAPRQVLVAMLRPGDIDGDLGVVTLMPAPYRAEAIADTTCLCIEASAFTTLLAARPDVARRWHASVATRCARSQQRLVDLLGVPLAQQVARIVLDEADGITFPYSQWTISRLLGARRPSVNKVLKDFERRGLLRTAYGSLTITDRNGLVAAAGRGER